MARISLTDFSSSGVSYLDLTTINSNLKGFNGGFAAGDYGSLVPCTLLPVPVDPRTL